MAKKAGATPDDRHKFTEQDFKKEAEFLKAVTETNPDMINIVNLQTRELEFVNRKAFVMQGFGTEEDHFEDREIQARRNTVHPDDREATENYFRKFLEMSDDEMQTLEYRATNDRGEFHWYHVQGKVFKRENGIPSHCINIVRNITERKKAEQEILDLKNEIAQQATNKYYSLFNSIGEGYCLIEVIFNEEGKAVDQLYLEVNAAYQQITGQPNPSGKLLSQLRKNLKPESYWLEGIDKVIKTGEPWRVENYVEDTQRWYSSNVSKVDKSSHQIAIVFNDITERKQREEKQEYLLKLSDTLRPLSDAQEIENEACRILGEYLDAYRVYYPLINEPDGIVIIENQYLRTNASSMAGTYPLEVFNWAIPLLHSNEMLIVNDIYESEFIQKSDLAILEATQLFSFVAAPIIKNGKLLSGFTISDDKPRIWKKQEIELVRETAERMWATAERAKAEEALQKSEQKYRGLFDTMEEGFVLCGIIRNAKGTITDFKYLEVNSAFEQQTGAERQAFIGLTFTEILPKEEADKWISTYKDIVDKGEPVSFEDYSGQLDRWFMMSVYPNNRNELSVFFRDISERKRMEEALRESQNLLARTFDALPMGIGVLDKDGVMRRMNPQMEYFLPNAIIPSSEPARMARWHGWDSEGKPVTPQNFPSARALRGEKVVPGLEMLYEDDNGHRLWTQVSSVPLQDENGAVTGAITTVFNIDDLKRSEEALRESEEKYRTLFNTMNEGMVICELEFDTNGKPLNWKWLEANPAFENESGIKRENIIGTLLSERFPIDSMLEKYSNMVKTQQSLEFETYSKMADRWLHIRVVPLGGKQFAVFFRNINERKLAEIALRKSEEKYRLLFETIEEGFAIMKLIRDEEGQVVDLIYVEVNKAFERHTGLKNVVGKRSTDIIPHYDPNRFKFYQNLVETGETSLTEFYVSDINRWLRTYYSRLGGPDSDLIVAVFEDITERKVQEQRQAYLLKLSDALRSLSDAAEIEKIACRLLGEELKADRVFYSEYHEAEGYVKVRQDYLGGNSLSLTGKFPISAYAWVIPLYRKGEPLIISDIHTTDLIPAAYLPDMENAHVISCCIYPLIKNNILVGTLAVTEATPRQWNDQEIELLTETAERIWAAAERAKAEEALRINKERKRAQKEAIQSVVNDEPLSESLHILTDLVTDETTARTSFYIVNDDGTMLHTIRGAGNMPAAYSDQVDGFPIGLDSFACGLAIPTGLPVVTADVKEDPLWKPWLHIPEQFEYRACWSFPIKTRDNEAVGTFAMYFKDPHEATSKELAFADMIAQTAAIIISSYNEKQQRLEAEKALKKSQEQLARELEDAKILQQISNKIIKGTDIQVLYELLVQSASQLMHSDMASIQILDKEKNKLYLKAHKNFHQHSAEFWHTVTSGSGSVCGEGYQRRITVRDIELEDFAKGELEIFRLSGIRAVQSTPLISSSGKQAGMLNTQWKQPRDFSEEDFRFFDVLARQAADLIERQQTEEELKRFNIRLEQQVNEQTRELKERQGELEESNKQLIHTISQLESFNYIASHDLQEPLRKVKTFASLIKEFNLDNEKLNSFITGINNATTRMSDLIESLLTYSRIAKPKDAFRATDLNQILEDVKIDFEIIIKEKQAVITSDKLPTVNAIPFQMYQLFANLISNSLKFNNRKPEITITCRILSNKETKNRNGFNPIQKYIELKFIDNGIGFESQYRTKIFQVFQRLHSKSEYSGTGIGLSIVERIVKNHHGYIEATSEKGKGSVFTVYLLLSQ